MAESVAMSPEPNVKRLFVGTYLNLQQQELLGKLSQQKSELERHLACKVRLVKQHKLHLTWLFLGDVQSAKLPEIQEKLRSIVASRKELSLTYKQIQLWPSAKRARMIVFTPEIVPGEVHDLASSMASELAAYVSKPGHREYRPHITLARLQREDFQTNSFNIPDRFAQACALPIVHQIKRIELIQSELGQQADEYKTLFSLDLN